jgi:hypothetical protein
VDPEVVGLLPSKSNLVDQVVMHTPSNLNLCVYRADASRFGRWINRDFLGEAGGINLYAYVESIKKCAV